MEYVYRTEDRGGSAHVRSRLWVDPAFGLRVGREVHDAWRKMVRNKLREVGYREMTYLEKMEVDSEVAEMKVRAYMDAVEGCMIRAGTPEHHIQALQQQRDAFETRVAPGGPSDDAIGRICAAREHETMLLQELRFLGLVPDMIGEPVINPFEAPGQAPESLQDGARAELWA